MMIEVFFDGKCGLCSKEIAYYQRIAPSGIFVWLDIATDASPLAAHQISQADACAISMFGMQQVTGILVLRPFW